MYEPLPEPALPYSPPRPKFQDRRSLHAALFVLTLLSTTLVGASYYAGYLSDFGRREAEIAALSTTSIIAGGFWYSGTILLILGAHELGHYLACRYYQVDASLPFFIPMPIVLTGTLGAFIKIRQPIPTKPMLFDIGIAGPLAGFAFAVPALFFGVAMSPVVKVPADLSGFNLGEPILFQAASWLIWGPVAEGYSLNLHPMGFAAWFGLLATALNLFPVGQLDGGHIAYAVLGRRSTAVTLGAIALAIALTFVSTSWIVWTFLLIAMTLAMGPRHPRTADEEIPLDRTRIGLAWLALLILVLCFTHNPIEPTELLTESVRAGR